VKNQTKQKRQVLDYKQTSWKNTFLSRLSFSLFSLTFTTRSFLANHTNMYCSVSKIIEQVLLFLGAEAHSATAALLSICHLLFGKPLLIHRTLSV